MKQVGVLQEIIRHPVKSMRGESLPSVEVDAGGLYGDRSHAFWNEAEPGEFLSGLDVPKFVEYHAAFVGDVQSSGYPAVEVTTPSGHVYRWGDEGLNREIAEAAGVQLRPDVFEPGSLGASWEGHILLTTDASLRAIEQAWGEGPLDGRRFRGNLLVTLHEDLPFAEETWVGQHVQIGDIILRVNTPCKRCDIINIGPDDAELDRSVLKAVAQSNNANFGVHCSVVQTGTVRLGDKVLLLD